MPGVEIITTSDGSHSLINTDLQETYHSTHGAIQESKHVFIRSGLDYWLGQNTGKQIRILEMGFGTGLNALLTLLESSRKAFAVYYETWEMFPVELSVVRQLNYGDVLGMPEKFQQLHEAEWNEAVRIAPDFLLHKKKGDFQGAAWEGSPFDLIYYDAFAPSKQPHLWEAGILKKTADALAPAGVWVTYSAKGQVKRDLRSFGLAVETLPGAPGKKEMTRALRQNIKIHEPLRSDAGI
jgi:tRNA U34 5-methylaminomethyl-2-thiouridine-forming methyltransferase MnmC